MSDQQGFTPEHLARIVRWFMIVFFIYVLIYNIPWFGLQDKEKHAPAVSGQPITSTASKTESPDCSGNVFTNFSLFAMPLFPVTSSTVAITDVKIGEGATASCGQKATLRYSYATHEGDVIFSNMKSKEVTKDVVIGSGEMLRGLERGLIGMKAGGERNITIPPGLGFGGVQKIDALRDHDKFKPPAATNLLIGKASLVSLSPVLDSPLKLRIIDQAIGNGRTIECGDTVSLKLTLWKMDGTSLYSNESGAPLHFTVSNSQMPYGVELGVIGMTIGGKRTLIIPPAYAKPLFDNGEPLLKDARIPESEILLAAIEVVADPTTAAAKPSSNNTPAEKK